MDARLENMRSAVNQNGSFESDRILKAGRLLKRTKITKAWKPAYLVLRPNVLSVYKDDEEKHLRHQIILAEVTAVTLRRDRKGKDVHPGVFGIFTPSRNYHLEAESEPEARNWIQIIRIESHLDQDGGKANRTTSAQQCSTIKGHFRPLNDVIQPQGELAPPSSDHTAFRGIPPRPGFATVGSVRHPSDFEMSSNEAGSYSDFSDGPMFGSARDLQYGSPVQSRQASAIAEASPLAARGQTSSHVNAISTPFYKLQIPVEDGERVIWHGFMQCRKSQGHVRQWKKYWVVLRYKSLALYKGEEEYAALLIIPLSTIIDVVETDPLTKNKTHCMQIITDERSYRFCVKDEEDLSNWIGRIKSVLAKRKEAHPK